MYDWEVFGIKLVIALVIVGAIASFFVGPRSPFAGNWKKRIHELEVKIKMDTGDELVQDLRDIAKLYVRIGKQWEAEQALRRALVISKQQWGEKSDEVLAILKDFVRIMDSLNRKGEATHYRKEIKKIKGS